MTNGPERIETDRLVLRRPARADVGSVFDRYASDPEVTRYLAWRRHRTSLETEAFFEFSESEWNQWPAGPYLIESRCGGRLLGGTGLGFESPTRAVTGYVLARDSWGFGYATEALRAMVELARELDLHSLYALCHPDHHASARVLVKCGFRLEQRLDNFAEFPNLAPGVCQDCLRFVRAIAPITGCG